MRVNCGPCYPSVSQRTPQPAGVGARESPGRERERERALWPEFARAGILQFKTHRGVVHFPPKARAVELHPSPVAPSSKNSEVVAPVPFYKYICTYIHTSRASVSDSRQQLDGPAILTSHQRVIASYPIPKALPVIHIIAEPRPGYALTSTSIASALQSRKPAAVMEFHRERQIKYFQRCYNTVLPAGYTSMDSNRLFLGFFVVAGLDLLSAASSTPAAAAPPPLVPLADRRHLRAWVLSQQHRLGGFCGSPSQVQPETVRRGCHGGASQPAVSDPENISLAGTFFALILLGTLAEENEASLGQAYRQVNRIATLRWLKTLQRPDGSFGEVIRADGVISGGRDMRYCYMAAATRWILRGHEAGPELDIDVDGLVCHVRRSQAYDGGIAESHMGEGQAGYAYCAVATLALLDRAAADAARPNRYLESGIPDIPALVHWLVCRQLAYTEDDESDDDAADDATTAAEPPASEMASLHITEPALVGYNGRPNKVVDTCYTWWVAGALRILSEARPDLAALVGRKSARAFLLEKTQSAYGGFGKKANCPPDLYHSYLGLAALATLAGDESEAGLGKFDVHLCLGKEAANRLTRARDYLFEPLAR